jgi:hypothetical protein
MSTINERIAAIIGRAQQFGGMESTSTECIADDIVKELGLTQFWSVAYADGYHAEGTWENWDEARDHAAEDPDDSTVITAWATGWEDAA